jgi:hypothetical protein
MSKESKWTLDFPDVNTPSCLRVDDRRILSYSNWMVHGAQQDDRQQFIAGAEFSYRLCRRIFKASATTSNTSIWITNSSHYMLFFCWHLPHRRPILLWVAMFSGMVETVRVSFSGRAFLSAPGLGRDHFFTNSDIEVWVMDDIWMGSGYLLPCKQFNTPDI